MCFGYVQRIGVGIVHSADGHRLLLAMRKQRQPLPDTHYLHATIRVETAQRIQGTLWPYQTDTLAVVVGGESLTLGPLGGRYEACGPQSLVGERKDA